MGFRFRKTFGSGPFRFTVSKRGVSASVGVKGLRVTSRADGRTQVTASIPGTGISYVQTFGASRESDLGTLCNALGSSAAPPCASVSVPDRYPVREVASGQQSHGDQASTGSGSDATRWLLAGGTTGAVIFILVVLAVLGVDPVVFWLICLALVALYGALVFPFRYYLRRRSMGSALLKYLISTGVLYALFLGSFLAFWAQGLYPYDKPGEVALFFGAIWGVFTVLAFVIYAILSGPRALRSFRSNIKKI